MGELMNVYGEALARCAFCHDQCMSATAEVVATGDRMEDGRPDPLRPEGYAAVTGAAIQWIRDGANLIADSAETEALAL